MELIDFEEDRDALIADLLVRGHETLESLIVSTLRMDLDSVLFIQGKSIDKVAQLGRRRKESRSRLPSILRARTFLAQSLLCKYLDVLTTRALGDYVSIGHAAVDMGSVRYRLQSTTTVLRGLTTMNKDTLED